MQAIQTKYHGPTNHSGARISARCDAARIVVPYDHALDVPGNHRAAALQLGLKLDWVRSSRELASGCLPDGSYVHVLVGKRHE